MMPSAPGCRAVCKGTPGEVIIQLVAAFREMRARELSEEQAPLVASDPDQVAGLLPPASLGAYPGIADALVSTGCAECSVNRAYADLTARDSGPEFRKNSSK